MISWVVIPLWFCFAEYAIEPATSAIPGTAVCEFCADLAVAVVDAIDIEVVCEMIGVIVSLEVGEAPMMEENEGKTEVDDEPFNVAIDRVRSKRKRNGLK